uniref:HTH CENPB-type domain-containing protein n=1 Tax=Setaria digitata TaxID=48799 RepID=A0A915PUM7_9BILA
MVDDIATTNLKGTSRKRKHTPTKSGRSSGSSMLIGNGSNNCGAESMITQKGRKLKQYVLEEKLDIIDYAKIIGNRAAGREFNVAESSIREWRKNEQRLRSMFETTPERSRLDGGGRRPVSEDLEKGLLQYVASRSEGETALTWHDIKEKANALWKDICDRNPEYNDRGFTANMGWVARFVRRNNITLQVTNSASTIAPKLVSSSSNRTKMNNDPVNQIDGNSSIARCNTSKIATISSAISPSANDNMNCNDATTITAAAAATTTTATTTTTTTTIPTTTITAAASTAPLTEIRTMMKTGTTTTATVAITTIPASGTVTVKKRRKNFTPKKIVPNDVVYLATTNKTIENTTTTPITAIKSTTTE